MSESRVAENQIHAQKRVGYCLWCVGVLNGANKRASRALVELERCGAYTYCALSAKSNWAVTECFPSACSRKMWKMKFFDSIG